MFNHEHGAGVRVLGGGKAMSGAAERPYAGHALIRVQPSGKVRLPDFARQVLERHPSTIFIGLHPALPCLIAFDGRYQQRLSDEISGESAGGERQARMRRVFGTTQEMGWPCDHLRLPDLARRKAMIAARALFVGIGGAMEIWDPQLAAQSGDEVLEELAALHLDGAQAAAG
jgi:DNA-binding transcriptional regulator/RsmH inhibitor MraZ